jgi:hypothetical protein
MILRVKNMVEARQEQPTIEVVPKVISFSPTEMEIYKRFKSKGFAVAHIDEHRKLWEWSLDNKCGIYIGRRLVPTDPNAGNTQNKWANPYKLDGKFPGDGKRDKVILSFYQHISNKASLHEEIEKQLQGKILFCHCRKNIRNNKTNRCHGDVLAALANKSIPFLDTNLSTGIVEFNKLYEDSSLNQKQTELKLSG